MDWLNCWKSSLKKQDYKAGVYMVLDPYRQGLTNTQNYVQRSEIKGRLVAVLRGRLENRGLELMGTPSRVLNKNEIHELILTNIDPSGIKVDAIAYLGFARIEVGGVLLKDDEVFCQGMSLGVVLGFDSTHLPNHLNIILKGDEGKSGEELGINLGDELIFRKRV